ncbi:MAG TPA: ABC transporter ATP-binding protein [Vicinamibacterales bacterium]|nr:ABC transporter ATP-binding protein [Vicinamibacterales bacterium]
MVGLTKYYGSKRGVIDLSFQVDDGEVFGFLGPNGAGKTTTMRLLMSLLFPDSGSARIAGLDCWQRSVAVKRVLGYLPGELAFDPNLTGGQILAYFANLRGGVDRAYLDRIISRLDLDTSRRFRHYSHGNKQKVGVIQAFMHRARLLILDEPTTGLDPLNQHEFGRMVAEVRAEGRTVFLSSHILSEVESMCDRVGIIRDGRLVRVGSVAELKNIKHHEVDLTFTTAPPADAFRGVAGVARLEVLPDGRTLRVTIHGDVDPLIKMAARYPLANFVSREPSLEDVFLRFYQADVVS